jgi:hypothetical protein
MTEEKEKRIWVAALAAIKSGLLYALQSENPLIRENLNERLLPLDELIKKLIDSESKGGEE